MGLFRSRDQGKTWQDMRVDRFSPFTYGRDIKVSPQDPNTLRLSQRRGLIERRRALPQPGRRQDLAALRQGDAAWRADVGRSASTAMPSRSTSRRAMARCSALRDGGESWLEMPLPQGVQHVYALACG
jgi:hypothetical protein